MTRPRNYMEETVKEKFSEETLTEARIPKRFWNLDRKDYFGKKSSLEQVENYIRRAPKAYRTGVGLLFVGDRDCGKTFLLTYLLRCLMLQKFTVAYYTMDEITTIMTAPEADDEKFNVKFSAPHFLGLDDVDSTQGAPIAALKKLVRLRRDNGLPLLVCTSLCETDDGDLFKRAYGDTAERVIEISKLVELEIDAFRIRKHYRKLKRFLK